MLKRPPGCYTDAAHMKKESVVKHIKAASKGLPAYAQDISRICDDCLQDNSWLKCVKMGSCTKK